MQPVQFGRIIEFNISPKKMHSIAPEGELPSEVKQTLQTYVENAVRTPWDGAHFRIRSLINALKLKITGSYASVQPVPSIIFHEGDKKIYALTKADNEAVLDSVLELLDLNTDLYSAFNKMDAAFKQAGLQYLDGFYNARDEKANKPRKRYATSFDIDEALLDING